MSSRFYPCWLSLNGFCRMSRSSCWWKCSGSKRKPLFFVRRSGSLISAFSFVLFLPVRQVWSSAIRRATAGARSAFRACWPVSISTARRTSSRRTRRAPTTNGRSVTTGHRRCTIQCPSTKETPTYHKPVRIYHSAQDIWHDLAERYLILLFFFFQGRGYLVLLSWVSSGFIVFFKLKMWAFFSPSSATKLVG